MDKHRLSQLITEEKKKRDTVIIAHTYQAPEIIDIADITGDSFVLSVEASKLKQKRVIMCGVRFMAETVKILSPEKTVIMPRGEASCPMATQIEPTRVAEYKKNNPDVTVVAYINTTTELKAVSDVCVTSSSAAKIVQNLEADKILFIPDKNLGGYIKSLFPEKHIELWEGCCPVHDGITEADVISAMNEHPGAKLAVHPECRAEVIKHADMVGATSAIINYINSLDKDAGVIVGTERGVSDYICEKDLDKKVYQLKPEKLTCRDMKITSLEDVYRAVIGDGGEEIELDEAIRTAAKRSIDNMIKYGN